MCHVKLKYTVPPPRAVTASAVRGSCPAGGREDRPRRPIRPTKGVSALISYLAHLPRAARRSVTTPRMIGRPACPEGGSQWRQARWRGLTAWWPSRQTRADRTDPERQRGKDAAGGPTSAPVEQIGRRERGARASVGSPRWVRIVRMTTGSSMVATTRMRPPQRGQANTSTAKVWRIRSGHDHRRGAGGGRSSMATVVAGSRLAAGVDDTGAPRWWRDHEPDVTVGR
jgi:hypothetical protein